MADHSTIEWTEATWNVVTGCSIKSKGCKNCYAMKLAGGRLKNHWSRAGLTQDSAAGPVWTGEVRFNEPWLFQPLQWGRGRQIFVAAHSDLFHEDVPFAILDKVFAVMALAPRHTYQVLTKRPDRMLEYFSHPVREALIGQQVCAVQMHRGGPPLAEWTGLPMPHVQLGVSVEDGATALERREPLMELARAGWTTWASYEPALGAVDWRGWAFLARIVSGGESGPDARMHLAQWHRDTRDYCREFGIGYFFKQWGCWAAPEQIPREAWTAQHDYLEHQYLMRVDKKAAGRLLDGVLHDGGVGGAHG